jgi:hypothetical protein
MSAASGLHLDLAWSVRERVAAAFHKTLADLKTSVEAAKEPPDLIAASEPAHFQRACLLALASVTDIGLDESLPASLRQALRALPARYQDFLLTVQPAAQAITAAAPELRNIAHIEGMAGVLFHATQAANPSTPVGVAAIGGATIGTLFMPGIGTAIGGALGVLLGGTQASQRDRRALERYIQAVKLMWVATEDLQRNLWNHLVHSIGERDAQLPDAAFFETADVRWHHIAATGRCDTATLETYLRDWGPHPDALHALAQSFLPQSSLDLPRLVETVRRQESLYPADARTQESQARLALEQSEFAQSLEAAERGQRMASGRDLLRHTRIEALAALGRVAEAEGEVRGLRATVAAAPRCYEGELSLVRGLLRGDRKAEAADRVRAWVARDDKPAWIAQQLRSTPLTATLLESIPELAAIAGAPTAALQAAVQRHLHADHRTTFFGEAPNDKGRNARESFLQLAPDEPVLFFYDWSLWHNAKTGLAITTRRLVWKAGWETPTSIDLSTVKPEQIRADRSTLHVAGKNADTDAEAMAASLAAALREVIAAIHGAPRP